MASPSTTPPLLPTIPRSQPPRFSNAPSISHAHSSPVVPLPGRQRQASTSVHRVPSAPLVAGLSAENGLAAGTGAGATGSGSGSGSGSVSGTSQGGSTSSRVLVTPGTGDIVEVEGPGPGAGAGASASLAGTTGTGATSVKAVNPLSRGFGLTSTASSTTSVNGLLAAHASYQTTPATAPLGTSGTGGGGSISNNGNASVHTPTYHPPTHGPSVNHTPQTGASKMAAAAKRGLDGLPSAVGLVKMMEEEEGHPLSEKSLRARDYRTIHTLNRLFHLPARWRLLRPLGQGAYGLVISVQDTLSGEPVAVKCITRVFDKPILAKRALREITLLRHFQGHENLTGLIDLDNVWEGYNEIYLYMEPMEADLHQIVRSGQPLSTSHIQFFMYQLFRGMKYIHTANVIHRDLKPGNLLVNSDCELKICDFGLARGFRPVIGEGDQNDEMRLTEYVATRWYRAPEVMLSNRRYTTAIDVWSIGCILAELLGLKPIFKGKDYVDQLNLILEVLGTPDDETLARVGSEKACAYIKTLPVYEKQEFATLFPDADPDAIDLLDQLLQFDPCQRTDVTAALSHPFLAVYHDPLDEPSCPEIFEKWEEVESLTTIEELREAISREIAEFREEVRTVDVEELEQAVEAGWAPASVLGVAGLTGAESGLRESPMPDMGLMGMGETLPVPAPGPAAGGVSTQSPGFGISPRTTMANLPDPLPGSSPSVRSSTLKHSAALNADAVAVADTNTSVPFPIAGPRSASIATTSRRRDASPSTPATALSEESFGNPFSASASGSGRASRRASGVSMSVSLGRRPSSFLFSPLMNGMTPLQPSNGNAGAGAGAGAGGGTGAGAQGKTYSAELASLANAFTTLTNGANGHGGGGGGGNNLPNGSGSGSGSAGPQSATWHQGQGRRSRAPSQSGMGLLIRQLSVADITKAVKRERAENPQGPESRDGRAGGEAGVEEEVPPMSVSPSDAPPSEIPKGFQ